MFLGALVTLAFQNVTVAYDQFAGLQVKLNGVPFVSGSSFQYFDAATGKGLYSSRWTPKEVSTLPDGTVRVRYSGENGNVIGTHEFTQRPSGMTARYEFRYRGDHDVRVENCLALVWAPVVSHGAILVDHREPFPYDKPVDGDWPARKIGEGNQVDFDATLAQVSLNVRGSKASLYDARGYGVDWAKFDCFFWIGDQSLVVHPGQTTEVTAEWTFQPRVSASRPAKTVALQPQTASDALLPPTKPAPVVPPPKSAQPTGATLRLTSGTEPPGAEAAELVRSLAEQWRVDPDELRFGYGARIDPAGLEREGFELQIAPNGVSVRAHDAAGKAYADRLAAQLATPAGGALTLPCGTWRDNPSVHDRGVHLFSGPGAAAFQRTLVERYLAPLRFDKAVVECSRTQWDGVPGSQDKPWASKSELAGFFATLRGQGIDPIPLIQSFGKMEWLLDGEFKSYAVNPSVPYTLDPRKLKARDAVKAVWNEAVDLLHPTTLHFGLDEFANRGMPDDPALPARLWKVWVPDLMALARSKRATPMAWGDMLLAPGEAPDATHARNAEEASQFRKTLTPGSIVADWHYKATLEPAQFTSLSLLKSAGLRPWATSWYQKENIRSHTLAAVRDGAGTLQATWAGYVTDESAVLHDPAQFSAYVVAADYAWSGRDTPVAQLGYDPADVMRRMLWGPPRPVRRTSGVEWDSGASGSASTRIGDVGFRLFAPVGLYSPLTSEGSSGSSTLEFGLGAEAGEVWLALDCLGWQKDGEVVARATVVTSAGETTVDVLYGGDVRATDDDRPTVRCESRAGVSALRIVLPARAQVTSVKLEPLSRTAGVRLRGVTSL